MPLEAARCPQCGANTSIDPSKGYTFCLYCGTRLQVHVSSLGVVSASVLSDIKDDTSIIAKRAALSHLKEQYAELKEKERLLDNYMQITLENLHRKESNRFMSFFREWESAPSVIKFKNEYLAVARPLSTQISQLGNKINELTKELNDLANDI
ncbi:MAG: zinc ribbon domain-containing protein [Anaerolineae bacterium]